MTWRLGVRGWIVWPLACIASCGGPTFIVQQYDGPPRPAQSIAVIRVNGGGPELFSLDGERLRAAPEKGTRLQVEVMPGAHEVGVVVPDGASAQGVVIRFMAEPGKVYRMVLRNAPPGGRLLQSTTAQAYEVDRSTDVELAPAVLTTNAPELERPVEILQ